jgi:hypothetical protein
MKYIAEAIVNGDDDDHNHHYYNNNIHYYNNNSGLGKVGGTAKSAADENSRDRRSNNNSVSSVKRRQQPGDGYVVNINPYISGMVAVSLGLKWADAIRRVCMYTKPKDSHKSIYAVLRGLFPVQELCACVTAIRLARRDVLGQRMQLWRLLLPAVVIHGMANFRGMKVRVYDRVWWCFFHVHFITVKSCNY